MLLAIAVKEVGVRVGSSGVIHTGQFKRSKVNYTDYDDFVSPLFSFRKKSWPK
jgi:hypothetical protein